MTDIEQRTAYPASKLREYTVIEHIGDGSFSDVKKARHTITGQIVAMKFLSKQRIQSTNSKTRVQREVEYMRKLRHPHIIQLYEVISTPTDIIIVLEYVNGELFKYIIENGPLPEHRARRFFQQIISGIEYSHKLKIIHRDLKPENVLLDHDLNVKIADFGLSNEIQDGDFLKTSCGSPNYAAPEITEGFYYSGPEVDVWSCGVVLYVMLAGQLPFDADNINSLYAKIRRAKYYMPPFVNSDAQDLIRAMLTVDPTQRIKIPEITRHPFYTTDLPRYLTPLPPQPGPVLGTLSALVTPPNVLDFEIIEGLGKIEEDIVDELASRMEGFDREEVWEGLRRDDGVQGNAVKVAYLLLRDKRRLGRDLAEFEEQERDAQLAAMDPRNAVSPKALSPGSNPEVNPFEAEFDGDDDGEDDDDGLDFSTPPLYEHEVNNFAVLDSSLPEQLPEPHHLVSYANAKRSKRSGKRGKKQRERYHFGIRSVSPPLSVMVEIYETLKCLGMEWKEKDDLGGLGGVRPSEGHDRRMERVRELDGAGTINLKAAAAIYFVEARARIQDVVVLFNIQLYKMNATEFVVDFHHKKSYKASTEPNAGKYDMHNPDAPMPDTVSESGERHSLKERDSQHFTEYEVVSPFVFMDVVYQISVELACAPGDD